MLQAVFIALYLLTGAASLELKAGSFRRPSVVTSCPDVELSEIMYDGYVNVFGTRPNRSRLAMGLAMIWFEDGHGKKIVGNNLGNIGASKSQPHHVIGGARFATWESLEEGARAYWSHMEAHCAGSLAYFDEGDEMGSSEALARCGYHRTPVIDYAIGLRGLYWQAYRVLEQIYNPDPR